MIREKSGLGTPTSPGFPRVPIKSRRARFAITATALVLAFLFLTHAARDSLAGVDWSRFAYVQHATDTVHLCNALMMFERLHALRAKPDRVLLYSRHLAGERETKMLERMESAFGVKLVPVDIRQGGAADAWYTSYMKLLAFNQTSYSRVVSLDSDATLLRSLDNLFLQPPLSASTPVAMPLAYWMLPEDSRRLSPHIMLMEPSAAEWARAESALRNATEDGGSTSAITELGVVNALYGTRARIFAHRGLEILTGEFRAADGNHTAYLHGGETARVSRERVGENEPEEGWDPVKALKETAFLHFSDGAVPKPWMAMSERRRETYQPACVAKQAKKRGEEKEENQENCISRLLWNGIYDDFANRREVICGARYEGGSVESGIAKDVKKVLNALTLGWIRG